MKLYYTKGACSLVVRIIICELGLKCDFESVDHSTKKTETGQDFLQINPKGAIPVLQLDNNDFLTEVSVILQYLADAHQATTLLPPVKDFKRYHVLEWLNFAATDLQKGFPPIFNKQVPDALKQEIFIPNIKRKFASVNRGLKNKKYIMGDQFSLPDAYLFVMLSWSEHLKLDISDNPELVRYHALLKQHPSIRQALDEEK